MKRHRNDDVAQLDEPRGYSDPTSLMFVPILLREEYADLDEATIDAMKRSLYAEITEPLVRTVGGKPVILNHRSNLGDFEIALHLLKVDEAARRVTRGNEREASQAQSRRTYTCRLCGNFDLTAFSDGPGAKRWCQSCLDEQRRQEVAEHAQRMVDGKSVGELIAATREQAKT